MRLKIAGAPVFSMSLDAEACGSGLRQVRTPSHPARPPLLSLHAEVKVQLRGTRCVVVHCRGWVSGLLLRFAQLQELAPYKVAALHLPSAVSLRRHSVHPHHWTPPTLQPYSSTCPASFCTGVSGDSRKADPGVGAAAAGARLQRAAQRPYGVGPGARAAQPLAVQVRRSGFEALWSGSEGPDGFQGCSGC